MKKITLLLVFIFTFLLSGVFIQAEENQKKTKDDCEYQFCSEDINGTEVCLWNGFEGEYCSCAGCKGVVD